MSNFDEVKFCVKFFEVIYWCELCGLQDKKITID